jgi:hypothetical protein
MVPLLQTALLIMAHMAAGRETGACDMLQINSV